MMEAEDLHTDVGPVQSNDFSLQLVKFFGAVPSDVGHICVTYVLIGQDMP